MAERVLRDITIIIFRRFSVSSSLDLLRQQHLENHKLTGMQFKLHRHMSIQSPNSSSVQDHEISSPRKPRSVESPQSSPQVETPNWDVAALRIITFLSSRINPNVSFNMRFEYRLVEWVCLKMIRITRCVCA